MCMDMTTGTDRCVNSDYTVFINGDTGQCQPLRAVRSVNNNMCANAATTTQDHSPADTQQIAICYRDAW